MSDQSRELSDSFFQSFKILFIKKKHWKESFSRRSCFHSKMLKLTLAFTFAFKLKPTFFSAFSSPHLFYLHFAPPVITWSPFVLFCLWSTNTITSRILTGYVLSILVSGCCDHPSGGHRAQFDSSSFQCNGSSHPTDEPPLSGSHRRCESPFHAPRSHHTEKWIPMILKQNYCSHHINW